MLDYVRPKEVSVLLQIKNWGLSTPIIRFNRCFKFKRCLMRAIHYFDYQQICIKTKMSPLGKKLSEGPLPMGFQPRRISLASIEISL